MRRTAKYCDILRRTATCCDPARRAATYCGVLRRSATYCDALRRTAMVFCMVSGCRPRRAQINPHCISVGRRRPKYAQIHDG
eukprot:9330910-Alexandrium_andersonii.AAC.1